MVIAHFNSRESAYENDKKHRDAAAGRVAYLDRADTAAQLQFLRAGHGDGDPRHRGRRADRRRSVAGMLTHTLDITPGVPMRRIAAFAAFVLVSGSAIPAFGQVTAYEGARLIDGDGRVVENGTLLVDGAKLAQAGPATEVRAPAGARRVDLSGKTVMPMIIDCHVHLNTTRDALERDLRRRAYWGVSAALSLGLDGFELLDVRKQVVPGAARFFSAGRGITGPEPGRTTAPFWVTTAAEGRKAVDQDAAHKVDIVKIWVDTRDGKYKKLTPEIYGAIIDEAHKQGLRITAHIFDLEDTKGLIRAGIDAFAHGVRDRDIDDELVAMFKERPNLVLTPNLPDRGVKTDLSWLRGSLPDAELEKLEA